MSNQDVIEEVFETPVEIRNYIVYEEDSLFYNYTYNYNRNLNILQDPVINNTIYTVTIHTLPDLDEIIVLFDNDEYARHQEENEENENERNECVICMEPRKKDKFCKLTCSHSFCSECVSTCVKARPRDYNCSLCRAAVKTITTSNKDDFNRLSSILRKNTPRGL
jgi:hypothetical protein